MFSLAYTLTMMNKVDQCDKTQHSDAPVVASERHAYTTCL